MSKDASSSSASALPNQSENEFQTSWNHQSPSRPPLNSIPDPSQYKHIHDSHLTSSFLKTPTLPHSEPNSAQTTPIKVSTSPGCTLSRLPLQSSNGGGRSRLFPRVSRAISTAIPEPLSADVPTFELKEDPLFWQDHNVQVLIRIRPFNNTEIMSQGYRRCLRQESAQTVVWLGHPESRFTFDHIACESVSQEKLFRVAGLPMVDNCMSGYNSCMFAYGQTGSGKTYTMMGEIDEMDGKPSNDCGITPRIFEYLFTRIAKEEERRKDERLTFSCKCSFLEIYNEQITDLLEPSSSNLQLREDLQKGVYVENLTEYSVETVNDVLKLLQQGAVNRKIAATHMNSESSRSHSVFTCIIESRWEKDSMAHLRFGRLNLVDLAGSERQKSSGAEGDRLREAANINKSLSTLGLVIMSLVDLAHGKHRHVPYRDSRLTFLLQDSLGGNSKTTIIANVSPSTCSANETLSTLKFAQRAKLIQNNAKINEDAPGNVIILQQQIQQLKVQLSFLIKHQHASERIDFAQSPRKYSLGYVPERNELHAEMNMNDEHKTSKGEIMKCDNVHKRLMDAESLIETMKLRQLQLIRKLESFQTENECLKKMLDIKEIPRREDEDKQEEHRTNQSGTDGTIMTALQSKLEKLSRDLKEAEILNRQYVEDHETRLTQDQQTELVRVEVEMETTKAIIQLQEDMDRLQSDFQEQLCSMAEQNLSLQNSVAAKEDELRMFCAEWERATLELTTFLIDGSRSLGDASRQIKCISSSFPIDNGWISERVERAAKICVENEETILLLQKSLEDAQMTVMEMEQKLYSLKGATIALTEFQQPQKSSSREEIKFSRMLNDPTEEKNFLGNKTLSRKGQILHNQFHAPNLVENISNDTSQLHVLKNESQMQMLEHTRNELVEINDRLNSMNACFHKVVNMHCNLDCTEDLTETDGWTTDYSSLCSYSSIGSVDNDDQSSTSERYRCSSKTTEQTLDQISDEESNLIHRRSVLLLKKELSKTYGAFVKLNNQLMIVYGGKKNQNRVNDILSFPDLHALEKPKEQGSDGHEKPTSQRAEAGSQIFEELAVTEKHSPLSSFFVKFEESYEIIKEADYMLRAMLNANENANMTMGMWKQAREEIMSDKASLTEEIKQLKSCILLRDGEKEVMQDEIQYCLRGKANISYLLDEHLSPMQTGVGELSGTAHGDATQVVEETQGFFCRSSLEDLMCKEMQNDISIFVLQCQMRDHFLKFGRLNTMSNSDKSALLEHSRIAGKLEIGHLSRDNNSAFYPLETEIKGDHIAYSSRREIKELDLVHDDMSNKNSDLKKELERKDILLKGLLFDFSLLQELVSNRNDIKYELEKLIVALSKVQKELELKTMQLDDLLVQNTELQGCLTEAEQALFNSTSELDQAKGTVNILSEQNVELKGLLQDLYLKNSEAEHLLEEQREVIESLEKELIRVSSSSEKQLAPSLKEIEENLTRVTADRDELLKKVTSLEDKLDVACALADENQAIAVEARQESEASKMYAEEKEEEVKILEYSVEELESTINVLEKKVREMEEEVEKQRLIRDSLEVQLQGLRNRLLTVEDLTGSVTSEKSSLSVPEDQLSRKLHFKSLEVDEAHGRIKFLEEANTKQAKEIKQFKDYISELVLHAEAQASQFQQKYKTLEAMLHKVNTDSSNVSATPTLERSDKISTKTRGSSSPFRCIAGLVQHMNQEKDQELSIARLRIEELEAQAASRHKEVCLLNTRLVTAESMTHDVIRDLLSVKLDLSNYANTIDQHQIQKLIEEAHHQRQEYIAMEHEIVNLRSQIDDLLEERERCISEINKSKSDQLGTQIFLEQLQERDQMLIAQNEMLKVDKSNLQKRVSELDDMVKKLIRMQESQLHNRPQRRNSLSMPFNSDLDERLAHSQKVLSRINNQLAQYSRPDGVDRRGNEVKYRKQKP